MNFIRRKKKTIKLNLGFILESYTHDLQMYKQPPIGDITLMEFEEVSLDRLNVLKVLEQVNYKGFSKSSNEYKIAVVEEIKKLGLKLFIRVITGQGTGEKEVDFAARRMDHISHFILRLAYCHSESLRRWLIAREVELFRLRWSFLSEAGQAAFMEINKLEYKPISSSERQEVMSLAGGLIQPDVTYYRVDFTQVLELVRSRSVFLRNGVAYIKSNEIIYVLVTLFRNTLSHGLAMTAKRLPVIEEKDERIPFALADLHLPFTEDEYAVVNNSTKININTLDSLSKHSFPLCMRQLHTTLRSTHHLKYGGRMQYGLFLKAIGVTLEDSLTFWREEFTKKIDIDTFQRRYSYSIRHNYGQEGKRFNYAAYNCMKIITGSVGAGETHGCPFKHYDITALRSTLQQANVSPPGVQEICELVTKGHFQLACAKYFELMHGGVVPEKGINHPNQYFEESQQILKQSGGDGKTKPVSRTPTTRKETSIQQDDVWGDSSVFESMDV